MRPRVRESELRAVGDAPDPDPVEAERLPNGLEVLGVIGRAVEASPRAHCLCARCNELRDAIRGDGALQRRTAENPGGAGAAAVERNERVPREQESIEACE